MSKFGYWTTSDQCLQGVIRDVKSGGQSFEATFEDGHISTFPLSALFHRRTAQLEKLRAGHEPITTWTAAVSSEPPTVSFEEVESRGVGNLLRLIKRYGFAFVDGMPATPEATEELVNKIGPIRNTHYGAFYDFTSDLSSKDTAYTAEALEPHTDTTYFTEPIGIQALHLLSHTDGSGGLSSLVDGFNAAFQLKEQHPEYYDILSRIPVYAHASGNEGISIQPALPQPVLTHYPVGHPLVGELMQIRWNNADRAGIAAGFEDLEQWYEAAGKYDELLGSETNQYWFQLKPGKCLFNRDDFISKLRMTNLSSEEIRASTVTG
ncbi:hypothetical protein AMS68_000710 [Peltaster fructicola]|uniref:TauD/TfdA-like domain-containing protein n=1 Tax=Peltaster fructicola TaxID=286661 RepID=A0A6H0XKE2_9PEZI|nr:hypothetical protein AMS68_000710 [Peltaster fructicola]